MRTLEVRRHTMRVKPGQHLSQEGVDLARRIGDTIGPFQRVVTSFIPRAFETAIAMGFAVDEQVEDILLVMLNEDIEAEVEWDAGFAAFAEAAHKNPTGATAQYVNRQSDFWRSVVESVPEGGAALIVSHGGVVEAGAVGCLPDADHQGWGAFLSYCEGVRLTYENGQFTSIEILRI
jgi:broad specificity phosphatase PhoE